MIVTENELQKLHQLVKIQSDKSEEAKAWKENMLRWIEQSYKRRFKKDFGLDNE